jgi:hypothetical protein
MELVIRNSQLSLDRDRDEISPLRGTHIVGAYL